MRKKNNYSPYRHREFNIMNTSVYLSFKSVAASHASNNTTTKCREVRGLFWHWSPSNNREIIGAVRTEKENSSESYDRWQNEIASGHKNLKRLQFLARYRIIHREIKKKERRLRYYYVCFLAEIIEYRKKWKELLE